MPNAVLLLATAALAAASAPELVLKSAARQERLDRAALSTLPHETVSVQDHGRTRTYSGTPLSVLVARMGAPTGEGLRGPWLAATLLATASDGYRVALSLAEVDPGMRRERVILADSEDGRPLAEKDGPLKLVVEGDLRPARAARHLVALELVGAPGASRPAR